MVLFNTRKKRIYQRKTTFRKKLYLRNITVSGINDGYVCGAALIRNGKVIAAVQEERLSNIKHHSGVPEISIKEVFKIANVHPSEIDAIAIVSLNRVTHH